MNTDKRGNTKPGTKRIHLTVRISENLRNDLLKIAEFNDRKLSEELREALEAYVQKYRDLLPAVFLHNVN